MSGINRPSGGSFRQQVGKTSRGSIFGFVSEVVAGGVSIFASVGNANAEGITATILPMWVMPSDVKSGVTYGPTGSEYTGTYSGGGGGGVSRGRITNA